MDSYNHQNLNSVHNFGNRICMWKYTRTKMLTEVS